MCRDKKIELAKRQTTRNVFRCHVIGPRDAGKTTFCQGLLGRSRQDISGVRPSDFPRNTVDTVAVYGQEKYLVLEDIDVRSLSDALMPSEVLCDVCCLVYDVTNPRSFEFVARTYLVSGAERHRGRDVSQGDSFAWLFAFAFVDRNTTPTPRFPS